jgi:hypothetical protein
MSAMLWWSGPQHAWRLQTSSPVGILGALSEGSWRETVVHMRPPCLTLADQPRLIGAYSIRPPQKVQYAHSSTYEDGRPIPEQGSVGNDCTLISRSYTESLPGLVDARRWAAGRLIRIFWW